VRFLYEIGHTAASFWPNTTTSLACSSLACFLPDGDCVHRPVTATAVPVDRLRCYQRCCLYCTLSSLSTCPPVQVGAQPARALVMSHHSVLQMRSSSVFVLTARIHVQSLWLHPGHSRAHRPVLKTCYRSTALSHGSRAVHDLQHVSLDVGGRTCSRHIGSMRQEMKQDD